MLLSLSIRNIALIEECTLTLERGLNILSGETGAGKSIIIDALSFVLGSRADKSLIRYGATSATVEAVFTVDASLYPLMEEMGLEGEDTVVVKRTMTDSRQDVKVNGAAFSLAMLRRLTASLVDIHGQHEHQSLLRTETHLDVLDRYGNLQKELAEVAEAYDAYRAVAKDLARFGDEAERARRLDTLAFQIEDITKVNPQEGEEEELLATRDKMRNAEKIVGGAAESLSLLDGDEGVGALQALSLALSRLNSVSRYDKVLEDWADRLDSVKIEVDDVASGLRDYVESFDFDARYADRVERRVDELKRLKRKYGATVEEVLASLAQYQAEYDALLNAEAEIEKLTRRKDECTRLLYNACVRLSHARQQAARRFEADITAQLNDLAMKGTRFSVSFAPLPDVDDLADKVTKKGLDSVEFLISPNVGEPLKPLAKIASGGEMSRFMLALKNIIARLDNVDTLVFDEIDTGISGVVAHTVAKKLYNISRTKQVIAVTHLPQLASFADHHYLIEKSTVADKTRTDLILLSGESRVAEVARLAGSTTQAGLQHALSLIAEAARYKDEG